MLQPGEAIELGGESWRVLPAAGHDHAMVMFWCERQGVLISADALWQKGFGVIFPELAGIAGFAEQAPTLQAPEHELAALSSLHHRVHALAETLCHLHLRGRVDEALSRLPSLHALRDELLDRLGRLPQPAA